jgi:hypothetical protein
MHAVFNFINESGTEIHFTIPKFLQVIDLYRTLTPVFEGLYSVEAIWQTLSCAQVETGIRIMVSPPF